MVSISNLFKAYEFSLANFPTGLDMGTDCNSVGVYTKMIHSFHMSMLDRLRASINSGTAPLTLIVDASTGNDKVLFFFKKSNLSLLF